MAFFDKFICRNKENNQELISKLDRVNFSEAAKNIEYIFEILGKQAQAQGYVVMAKKEMLAATGYYIEKPSLERAVKLIEQYPSYLTVFEHTKERLH